MAQKQNQQKEKIKGFEADSTEYDRMVGFDFFSSPLELETFEESVFGQENMEEPSWKDAFIDTFLSFDLWDQENQQVHVGVTNLSAADDRIEQQAAIWDPCQPVTQNQSTSMTAKIP
ncbi:hypothetical protein O181_047981 [Austropuccinia psidii MF-1]|uniref:Uncharacterized protein n=1 Tax=Austropuccinia psidii MF-1 TaxID=1389203 RepID=A0A9Q3DX47_9BASI|nr:hypothetical protein [Austropuccinia psidii MF-1]